MGLVRYAAKCIRECFRSVVGRNNNRDQGERIDVHGSLSNEGVGLAHQLGEGLERTVPANFKAWQG